MYTFVIGKLAAWLIGLGVLAILAFFAWGLIKGSHLQDSINQTNSTLCRQTATEVIFYHGLLDGIHDRQAAGQNLASDAKNIVRIERLLRDKESIRIRLGC